MNSSVPVTLVRVGNEASPEKLLTVLREQVVPEGDLLYQSVGKTIGERRALEHRLSCCNNSVVIRTQNNGVPADRFATFLDREDESCVRVRDAVPWLEVMNANLAPV